MTSTIAIMQPYFAPYAGYFRLIAASDLFVIYDCVQFPRRGWVHRNKLVDINGEEQWLTLPLQSAPQDVLIKDLHFLPDASALMEERLRPFSIQLRPMTQEVPAIIERLERLEGRPVDYIVDLMEAFCSHLQLPWNVVRSSSLNVPASFRGQDRILEIARRLGADRYVNAPGGRDLYDAATFAEAGIELSFLEPYVGKGGSILERVLNDPAGELRAAITASSGAA